MPGATAQMTSGGLQHELRERFESFYQTQAPDLLAYVRRRLDSFDAEDVLTQVFLVAWRRFETVPSPPGDRLWLFGVARRIIGEHRRSTMRRQRLQRRLAQEGHLPGLGPPELGHLHTRIETAMASLGAGEREVLGLVVWDGLSHGEAAAVLGC